MNEELKTEGEDTPVSQCEACPYDCSDMCIYSY